MKNGEKYVLESCGTITDAAQLKELQDDIRKLPNFNGVWHVATGVITRDHWVLITDRHSGAISAYFGTKAGFLTWLKEECREVEKLHFFPGAVGCVSHRSVSQPNGKTITTLEGLEKMKVPDDPTKIM